MSPPEFGVGDAHANCPPDFVVFQNFKHQVTCITMQYKAYQPIILTEHSLFIFHSRRPSFFLGQKTNYLSSPLEVGY